MLGAIRALAQSDIDTVGFGNGSHTPYKTPTRHLQDKTPSLTPYDTRGSEIGQS